MKVVFTALVAVFSFTQAFAAEMSAVEKVKTLKTNREYCDTSLKTVKAWGDKLNNPQMNEAAKMVAELGKTPSDDDLKTIREALKEDPIQAMGPYASMTGRCGLLRSALADKFIGTFKFRAATPDQKEKSRAQLLPLIKNRTYETYLDAMVNASILSKIYGSKVFESSKEDAAKLKESKEHLQAVAKTAKKDAPLDEAEHSGHVLTVVRSLAAKLK